MVYAMTALLVMACWRSLQSVANDLRPALQRDDVTEQLQQMMKLADEIVRRNQNQLERVLNETVKHALQETAPLPPRRTPTEHDDVIAVDARHIYPFTPANVTFMPQLPFIKGLKNPCFFVNNAPPYDRYRPVGCKECSPHASSCQYFQRARRRRWDAVEVLASLPGGWRGEVWHE